MFLQGYDTMIAEKPKDKFMLDIKRILKDKEEIQKRLQAKDPSINLDEVIELYHSSTKMQTELDELRSSINHLSKEIGEKKRASQPCEHELETVSALKEKSHDLNEELLDTKHQYTKLLSALPNIPGDDVPLKLDPKDNVCIKTVGEKKVFDFNIKSHMELGKDHDLFDFERGAKISGTGWTVYKGMGARLEWALLNLMIDTHIENGFEFHLVPHVVRATTMYGAGQLPKFKDQAYKVQEEKSEHYLIPTSEVPLNGLHMDEILDPQTLPKLYCAYSPCFRKEAGAAGKSERGLIRTHQFNKVELFALTSPDNSEEIFNKILASAESVLEKLELHHRNMLLVAGDSSFAGSKTVDIEVFLPGQNRYYEVSSITNCTDFQARRSKIRSKSTQDKHTQFVHTINGSGLATSRLMVSLLENNQNSDGSISIPKALEKYMNCSRIG
jgi:seryl-tRNA synthetase